jgi:hypothetical protein
LTPALPEDEVDEVELLLLMVSVDVSPLLQTGPWIVSERVVLPALADNLSGPVVPPRVVTV